MEYQKNKSKKTMKGKKVTVNEKGLNCTFRKLV